jgi:histidinol-phosphate aminotransferase
MNPRPRAAVLQEPESVHGALDFAELERLHLAPDAILDFSVNGNPYGPSPQVHQALPQVRIDRYPDREALALRRALATHLDVTPEQIVVGNGSSELLWLIAMAFLNPGDTALVVGPTFGEYTRAAALMGAQVKTCQAQPEAGFIPSPEIVAQHLNTDAPQVVFLCNPNNPTGVFLPPERLVAWARMRPQTLFVIDEAYLPFTAQAPSVLGLAQPNILVLHSMTKAQALAGLRLGYAVGPPALVHALAQARPPWNVNAYAQAAGLAALQDRAHLAWSLAQVTAAKQILMAGLHSLGYAPLPSATHFFLVPVPGAATLRQALLQHGILVRDCTSFGLPTYIRLATRRPEENARLLSALAEIPHP